MSLNILLRCAFLVGLMPITNILASEQTTEEPKNRHTRFHLSEEEDRAIRAYFINCNLREKFELHIPSVTEFLNRYHIWSTAKQSGFTEFNSLLNKFVPFNATINRAFNLIAANAGGLQTFFEGSDSTESNWRQQGVIALQKNNGHQVSSLIERLNYSLYEHAEKLQALELFESGAYIQHPKLVLNNHVIAFYAPSDQKAIAFSPPKEKGYSITSCDYGHRVAAGEGNYYFVLKDGRIITNAGFFLQKTEILSTQLVHMEGYYGSWGPQPYSAEDRSMLIPSDKVVWQWLKPALYDNQPNSFIALPHNAKEHHEFQKMVNEIALEMVQKGEIEKAHLLIEGFESLSTDTIQNLPEAAQKTTLLQALEEDLDDYATRVLKEQEEIRAKVASGNIYKKSKKQQRKVKSKPPISKEASTAGKQENKNLSLPEKLKKLPKGAVKYRTLAKIIANIARDIPANSLKLVINGSHQVLHGKSEKTFTLIYAHGKSASGIPHHKAQQTLNNFIGFMQENIYPKQ